MIVGAQKCGTVALHRFLSRHPEIGMSSRKEVHLFDAPEYSNDWTPEQIDERYLPFFAHCAGARTRGEATPIYLFFPEIARELKRYNPELKLIVLLRNPVQRAISHYYMEKNRDAEHRPPVAGAAERALQTVSLQGCPRAWLGDAGRFVSHPRSL